MSDVIWWIHSFQLRILFAVKHVSQCVQTGLQIKVTTNSININARNAINILYTDFVYLGNCKYIK